MANFPLRDYRAEPLLSSAAPSGRVGGNDPMKRAILSSLLATLACAPRPDPDALVTRQVSGGFTLTKWQDDGTRTAIADGGAAGGAVSAFSWRNGAERYSLGTLKSDGTFSVPSAPDGTYYLVLDTRATGFNVVVWETSSSTVAVDRVYAGRYDAALARSSTPVVVEVSNLVPWDDGVLEVASSNAGVFGLLAGALFNAPGLAPGSVDTFSLPPVDWYTRMWVPYLPDAARGDDVWVHQLRKQAVPAGQPGAGRTYHAAARFARITDLTLQSGTASALRASLVDAAPRTIALTVPVGQWEALARDMGPSPTSLGMVLSMAATPFATALPAPWVEGGIPDLLYVNLGAGSPDLSSVPFTYGQFLDGRWHEVLISEFRAYVQYPVAGGSPVTMVAKIHRAEAAPGDQATLTPVVSPPLNPVVNEKSLLQQETGVTTTPVLSWTPPRTGAPTSYELEVFRIGADGSVALVLHAFLRTPSFRVPGNILQPSTSYVARITAHSAPWDVPGYVGTYGFIPGYPFAFASCLTSTFTP